MWEYLKFNITYRNQTQVNLYGKQRTNQNSRKGMVLQPHPLTQLLLVRQGMIYIVRLYMKLQLWKVLHEKI